MHWKDKVYISVVVLISVAGGYLIREIKHQDSLDAGEYARVAKEKLEQSDGKAPDISVQEKKKRFKALLVPAVDKVYQDLQSQYEDVYKAIKKGEQAKRIETLKKHYKVTTDQQLLMALKPHPKSIVLAQAATESAWGTSRFFRQANNVFGVWSFDSREPRIAAKKLRGDQTIWLKRYDSIFASVKDNYELLARGDAFKEFRELRFVSDNPYELVKKLDRYSEKGDEYGEYLASMISYNRFDEYDARQYQREMVEQN